MKPRLMFRDTDFDLSGPARPKDQDLWQDLELDVLVAAMARENDFLAKAAREAIGDPLQTVDAVLYRQSALYDAVENEALIRQLYALANTGIEVERRDFMGGFSRSPALVLRRAVRLLEGYIGPLTELNDFAVANASRFKSEAFSNFLRLMTEQLSLDYLDALRGQLGGLGFPQGVLIGARLGKGNKGMNYRLHAPPARKRNWLKTLLGPRPEEYTFKLHPRDESGQRMLLDLEDRGVAAIATTLGRSVDHLHGFFRLLASELAFFVGCLNLRVTLAAAGRSIGFPVPVPQAERRHLADGLYDVCLALTISGPIMGNALSADGMDAILITGANRGGKSTFLRALGLAQTMMQAGMFVGAQSLTANLCSGIFTHYKREEDTSMRRGKFDEELSRMSAIADGIRPNSVMLFNESFASTNEREGSEIARQIVAALVERRVKIVYVTHLHDFANGLFETKNPANLFLRAQRSEDGNRTFRLSEGKPQQTSHGEDLYRRIFGEDLADP